MRHLSGTLLPLVLSLVVTGCSVTVVGAPCDADDACPFGQQCSPAGTCIEPERDARSACLISGDLLAQRAESCFGGDPSTWRKLVDLDGFCASVAEGVAQGRIDFDPDAFGACQRGLPTLACALLDQEDLLRGCDAFVPRVAAGGTCSHMSDCVDGYCNTGASCPGTCVAYVAPEADCSAAESRCRPGSSCVDTGEGLVCKRFREQGESCGGPVGACAPGNLMCEAGVCRPKQESGPCNPLASTCAPNFSCSDVSGSLTDFRCTPSRKLGEDCAVGRLQCAVGAYCQDGACREWPSGGEACGLSAGELTALCLNGTCDFVIGSGWLCHDAPREPGSGCGSDLECAAGHTCQGTCRPEFCGG